MSSAAPASAPSEASPLGLLAGGLERLRAEDLHTVSGPDQASCLAELFAFRNRFDAELTRRVAALDRSGAYAANDSHCHSAASWLRKEVRLAPNAACEQV